MQRLTLTDAVRDIVASMTPEEVLRDIVFADNVRKTSKKTHDN